MRKAGRAGRLPRLTEEQKNEVKAALMEGPEARGYSTALWTIGRVAALIQEITEVKYHKGHVWKMLRSLGWSSQRPVGRALERNEHAIGDWKKKQWPAIKKGAHRRANVSICRREWDHAKTSSSQDVGSERRDSYPPAPFQLGQPFCHRWDHALELLFSDVPRLGQSRAGGRS